MNLGMRVEIKFSKKGRYGNCRDPTQVLRNVTEIHYNYKPSIAGFPSVAFESNVHETGLTYSVSDVEEFEATVETKKEESF